MTDKRRALEFSGPALLAWCRGDNWPAKEMLYANATVHQVLFVRDTLPSAFAKDREEYRAHSSDLDRPATMVVATHRSKSCNLPVYGLAIASLGVRAVLRGNFHDWKVSIDAPAPVDLSAFASRTNLAEQINPVYCEGFDESLVLGPHATSPRRFTVSIGDEYDVYALFLTMAHQLRAGR